MIPQGFKVITHAPELADPIVPTTAASAAQVVAASKPAPAPLKEPSTLELAANFAGAVGRWSSAGFPVVSPEVYAARSEACDACHYWDGKARLGLGKCGAPGCGCTSLKRWLATERCPHPDGSRWPVDTPGK